MKHEYEHTPTLRAAQEAMAVLRKRSRKLWWMAGGKGYENMGRRELEQFRLKVDEAAMWLSAASSSLNAGGARAQAEGFDAGISESEDAA